MGYHFLIGIDDTDNLESRGTGFRVREMVRLLQEQNLAEISMVTRHQLLVNPAIPYTSHNSSASVRGTTDDIKKLQFFCENYLSESSAPGSDAGFCLCGEENVPEEIILWGYRAKREVLTMTEASSLANQYQIILKGLTGEQTGIIGSLAAVGLCKQKSDGRVLWMPGLRETTGIITVDDLKKNIGIERIVLKSGEFVPLTARIDLGDWFRPVMKDNFCTLYVEQTDHPTAEFRVAAKNFIKSISE